MDGNGNGQNEIGHRKPWWEKRTRFKTVAGVKIQTPQHICISAYMLNFHPKFVEDYWRKEWKGNNGSIEKILVQRNRFYVTIPQMWNFFFIQLAQKFGQAYFHESSTGPYWVQGKFYCTKYNGGKLKLFCKPNLSWGPASAVPATSCQNLALRVIPCFSRITIATRKKSRGEAVSGVLCLFICFWLFSSSLKFARQYANFPSINSCWVVRKSPHHNYTTIKWVTVDNYMETDIKNFPSTHTKKKKTSWFWFPLAENCSLKLIVAVDQQSWHFLFFNKQKKSFF